MRSHLMKGQRLAQFPVAPETSPSLTHQIMRPHLKKGQRLARFPADLGILHLDSSNNALSSDERSTSAQFPAAPRFSISDSSKLVDSLPVLGI